MSPKEHLLNEIEGAPDAMVKEILDFCLFLKQRQQAKIEISASSVSQSNGILDLLKRVHEIQAKSPLKNGTRSPAIVP